MGDASARASGSREYGRRTACHVVRTRRVIFSSCAGGQSYVGDVWRRRVTRREQGVTSRERPSQRTRRRGGGDGSLRSPAGTAPRIPSYHGGAPLTVGRRLVEKGY